jgi:hypothetical protein
MGAKVRTCVYARVALLVQHATHHHIITCGLSWLHLHVRHYVIRGTIFGKKLLDIKCIFLFSLRLSFETFLILRRIIRDIVINVKTYLYKVPIILVGF